MVVGDLKRNTLIEARGYKYKGQGKVQEIALNQVFKDIDNYDQLLKAYREKTMLERLGRDGSVVEKIAHFKLLSLASCMD